MHALSTMYTILSAPFFCTVFSVFYIMQYSTSISTSPPNLIRYINSLMSKLYNPSFLCIKCNNNPDT